MTPEAKARIEIDTRLAQAGWLVQDMKQLNLGASLGVAVREYPTDSGPADYVLFLNREAVGVIEAKRNEAGENITAVESQTERYANATLKWRKDNTPLPFLFEATGEIIRFTVSVSPPAFFNRSRNRRTMLPFSTTRRNGHGRNNASRRRAPTAQRGGMAGDF